MTNMMYASIMFHVSEMFSPQLEAEQIDKQELARSKIDALKVSTLLTFGILS